MTEAPPPRHFNKCSPFNQEQATFIVFKFGELQSIKRTQRAFRMKFFPKHPRRVPDILAFRRILDRFKNHATVKPQQATTGKRIITEQEVQRVKRVKKYFEDQPEAHIRQAVDTLQLSYGTIWRILQKELKWKFCKSHKTWKFCKSHKTEEERSCTGVDMETTTSSTSSENKCSNI